MAYAWDIETRSGALPDASGKIVVHEFDYTQENVLVYEENGVAVFWTRQGDFYPVVKGAMSINRAGRFLIFRAYSILYGLNIWLSTGGSLSNAR